jgi:hypothetical protein
VASSWHSGSLVVFPHIEETLSTAMP